MISKKLLSEVLAVDIISIEESYEYPNNHKNMIYFKPVGCHIEASVNIYELAHLCKEWANKLSPKRYQLCSMMAPIRLGYATCEVYSGAIEQCEEIVADTEPEVVFKACEWILETCQHRH